VFEITYPSTISNQSIHAAVVLDDYSAKNLSDGLSARLKIYSIQ
jgi:hypothetical protein